MEREREREREKEREREREKKGEREREREMERERASYPCRGRTETAHVTLDPGRRGRTSELDGTISAQLVLCATRANRRA
jgi:hypothetical protein